MLSSCNGQVFANTLWALATVGHNSIGWSMSASLDRTAEKLSPFIVLNQHLWGSDGDGSQSIE